VATVEEEIKLEEVKLVETILEGEIINLESL